MGSDHEAAEEMMAVSNRFCCFLESVSIFSQDGNIFKDDSDVLGHLVLSLDGALTDVCSNFLFVLLCKI